ncbi:MAG: energy transducer TonB [Prevotella sp.]
MLQRKTHHADIERLRPRLFLVAFFVSLLLFVIALNWPTPTQIACMIESIDSDPVVDIDLSQLKQDDHQIVAKAHEKPASTDRINKVDKVIDAKEEERQLKDKIQFTTSEADGADKLQEREAEPIAPPVVDMDNNAVSLRVIEELPEFPGGMSEFMQWLNRALKYPYRAQNAKQQGQVNVTFVVEKDGSITNIKLVKMTHTALDAEVLRVMRIMPKWKPATSHGKPCRAVVAVPVVFAL